MLLTLSSGAPARVCLVSFEPIKWEEVLFRSKGKLYALITEWRGTDLGSRELTSPWWTRPWGRLLYRDLISREGVEFSGAGAGVLLTLQVHWICFCIKPAAILTRSVCTSPCRLGALHAAPYEQAKMDEAPRERKKKRLDLILLPRFFFLGIVKELCWCQILPLPFVLLLILQGGWGARRGIGLSCVDFLLSLGASVKTTGRGAEFVTRPNGSHP